MPGQSEGCHNIGDVVHAGSDATEGSRCRVSRAQPASATVARQRSPEDMKRGEGRDRRVCVSFELRHTRHPALKAAGGRGAWKASTSRTAVLQQFRARNFVGRPGHRCDGSRDMRLPALSITSLHRSAERLAEHRHWSHDISGLLPGGDVVHALHPH
jgi:hypothetical protein